MRARSALLAWLCGGLVACSGSGSGTGDVSGNADTVVVNGDVPIVYVKRSTALVLNPTDGANIADGGELVVRERASPSAKEHVLTLPITNGKGDVSDPEVSADGKRILFSVWCDFRSQATVSTVTGLLGKPGDRDQDQACKETWSIWEYVMPDLTPAGLVSGTFRRLTTSFEFNDVDPAYLPAGRGIVFSSNRQAKSRLNQALGRAYVATDEYERERVFNLHTMDADGNNIRQISFNQSHDRNPVVRPNGDIMFSRWEHLGDRNRFAIFTVRPDGSNMFVLYGAQSAGNSYLHPRDMDPKGAYAGQLVSTLMPLARTQEGGDLRLIDAARYSEDNTPVNSSIAAVGGQTGLSTRPLNDGRALSLQGRATTPFPLWDGTDRVLVAWRPCQVTKAEVVTNCLALSPEEITRLQDTNRNIDAVRADPLKDNAPASYAIYMFNPAQQTWLIIASPPAGFMYTDPIALAPRPEPGVAASFTPDAALATQNLGLIEVRSVYDTDALQRMGDLVLSDTERQVCNAPIAQTAPTDPMDTRKLVADLLKIKDPADPAYLCTPVRFVRATRAVAPPSNSTGAREVIGETEFEQQQILGYAPIEPDGSFKLQVPADVPLAFAVVDSEGRAFQTHTNWIQVRPGERRTCDGCHSPRRGASLNSGAIVNTLPAALTPALASQHLSGETLAATRTRLDPNALKLGDTPLFTDIWADTTQPFVKAKPALALRYKGNTVAADDLVTLVPTNGVINYPEHIAPLWTRPRGPGGSLTCTNCHADAKRLDLRSNPGGTGRLTSYEELLLGDPLPDGAGRAQSVLVDGIPVIVRGPALVETSSSAANTAGQARKSRLTEILWGQSLLAPLKSRTTFPNPPPGAPDHATLLNKAEKRLLAEWMDLGGQYYNDPFNSTGGVRDLGTLDLRFYISRVEPILLDRCYNCHGAGGNIPSNRFVLTGSLEGDLEGTLSVINNTCDAPNNPLLKLPSTLPHPAGNLTQTRPLLPVGSAEYTTIATWIASGCPTKP
jgi:Hydrazine synthase alpha subunit middle domain/WD40-like Beta Propeller Repeat